MTPRTFHNWARSYPEFREALELARDQSAAYWSKQVRLAISDPKVRWKLLWEIVTKRFPEYWGPNAPDFWEQFEAADAKDKEPTFEEQVKHITDEELEERLAAILRAEEEATPSE